MARGSEDVGANRDANRRAANQLEVRECSAGEYGPIVAQKNAGAEQIRQIYWQCARLIRFELNQNLMVKVKAMRYCFTNTRNTRVIQMKMIADSDID